MATAHSWAFTSPVAEYDPNAAINGMTAATMAFMDPLVVTLAMLPLPLRYLTALSTLAT